MATSRKYSVTKNTILQWLKNKSKIFQAVEKNNVYKKRNRMKTATYEEVDSAKYK